MHKKGRAAVHFVLRCAVSAPCFAGAAVLKPPRRGQWPEGIQVVDLSQYLPILLFLAVALALSSAFVFLPMIVGRLTGAHKPDPEKLSEYECGFPAFEDPRSQFDVRFYLVAILFIIFDLEAAFLYPWSVSLGEIGWTGWVTMMIFIFELVLGLVYAWKKGALDWE
jgi:NADH-quinone oxidoreductase subunit A